MFSNCKETIDALTHKGLCFEIGPLVFFLTLGKSNGEKTLNAGDVMRIFVLVDES